MTTNLIAAKRISEQITYNVTYDFTSNRVTDPTKTLELPYIHKNDYITCLYDDNWYIGCVEEVCEEEGDIKVSFMHPKGPGRPENCFFWPSRGDICYIPENDILCKISAPIPSSKSARKYKISPLDTKATCEIIESRITTRRKQVD